MNTNKHRQQTTALEEFKIIRTTKLRNWQISKYTNIKHKHTDRRNDERNMGTNQNPTDRVQIRNTRHKQARTHRTNQRTCTKHNQQILSQQTRTHNKTSTSRLVKKNTKKQRTHKRHMNETNHKKQANKNYTQERSTVTSIRLTPAGVVG